MEWRELCKGEGVLLVCHSCIEYLAILGFIKKKSVLKLVVLLSLSVITCMLSLYDSNYCSAQVTQSTKSSLSITLDCEKVHVRTKACALPSPLFEPPTQ